MRWDNLRTHHGPDRGGPPLPPALPEAVIRTFETPDFAGMTCYDARATSLTSTTPAGSAVRFRYTSNPHRGCSPACAWCLGGDTPVLLANGRTKPIAEIRIGDQIYGTTLRDGYRRYVHTTVLDQWATVKPAYRVTLADGTQLVASGDHRLLTDRGWKHVTARDPEGALRPHLTTGNKLMGFGGLPEPPVETPGYRRGYLCGMLRGHGRITRGGNAEATDRVRRYLSELSAAGSPITDLGTWPARPHPDWRKGLLAGAFDAAGTCSPVSALRITSGDPELTGQLRAAFDHFGFDTVLEETRRVGSVHAIRIRGGLPAQMRFFVGADPAITRKRTLVGRAVKSAAPLGVVKVEQLTRRTRLYDLTTGTGDFIANGVISHNCVARDPHTRLDLDAGHDVDPRTRGEHPAPRQLRPR